MKSLRVILSFLLVAVLLPFAGPSPASAEIDVYSTPGTHHVNNRDWRTDCEPYSQTLRCRTDIRATIVRQVNGKFVQVNDWTFNNLTYLPSSRSLWKNNPLGHTTTWTSADGRRWATECDTPVTGRNGCRTYAEVDFITSYFDALGNRQFRWTRGMVFNNIVRFSTATTTPTPAPTATPTASPTTTPTASPTTTPTTTPTATPTPTVSPTTTPPGDGVNPGIIIDINLRGCLTAAVGVDIDELIPLEALAALTVLDCSGLGILTLVGLPELPNLIELNLSANLLDSLAGLPSLPKLVELDLSLNLLENLQGLPLLSALVELDVSGNLISGLGVNLSGLLPVLKVLDLSDNPSIQLSELLSLLHLNVLDLRNIDNIIGGNPLTVLLALILAGVDILL